MDKSISNEHCNKSQGSSFNNSFINYDNLPEKEKQDICDIFIDLHTKCNELINQFDELYKENTDFSTPNKMSFDSLDQIFQDSILNPIDMISETCVNLKNIFIYNFGEFKKKCSSSNCKDLDINPQEIHNIKKYIIKDEKDIIKIKERDKDFDFKNYFKNYTPLDKYLNYIISLKEKNYKLKSSSDLPIEMYTEQANSLQKCKRKLNDFLMYVVKEEFSKIQEDSQELFLFKNCAPEQNHKIKFDSLLATRFNGNEHLEKHVKLEDTYKDFEEINEKVNICSIKKLTFKNINKEEKLLAYNEMLKEKDITVKCEKIETIKIKNSCEEIFFTLPGIYKHIENYHVKDLIIKDSYKNNLEQFDKIFDVFFIKNKKFNLQSLIITNSNLTYEQLPIILNMFNYTQIENLNLSNNLLDFKAAMHIYLFFGGDSKHSLNKPKQLNLANNQIGNRGFNFIAELLGAIKELIDLSNNNITDEALEYFKDKNFIKRKKKIESIKLDIKNNAFSLECLKLIPDLHPISVFFSKTFSNFTLKESEVNKLGKNGLVFE